MLLKPFRLALAVVLIAVLAGACGLAVPDNRLTVAQLQDGRWAKGYTIHWSLKSPGYDLLLANGSKMKGQIISEEEARAFLNPPPSESSSESSSESQSSAPEPSPEPPSGCGVDYEC